MKNGKQFDEILKTAKTFRRKITKILKIGAAQRNDILVDLEKMLQNEYLVAKIGFNTAEI